ncbi:MAG: redoxin domain-containing protein [Planctomycetia bacterium]|nr:redoxin domain-containing protein [Planctomycetia bacterium]
MYDELREFGFAVLAVAFDKDPEDVRPWIELAEPSYPCVIDSRHVVADLYNMVNVPTILWIDEQGRIVRPNDVAFGDNTWQHITHLDAAPHARALRAWVRGEASAFSAEKVRSLQKLPTPADQLARAEFILGQWLYERGQFAAAARHFDRAGELAPHDFTIRRGTMAMRGLDPTGPDFFAMTKAWRAAGNAYYHPLSEE